MISFRVPTGQWVLTHVIESALRHRHASRGRGTADRQCHDTAVPAKRLTDIAQTISHWAMAAKLLPGLWARAFFANRSVPSLSNRQRTKRKRRQKGTTTRKQLTPGLDKKDADKKHALRKRLMQERRKEGSNKDEKKRRKEVKGTGKDVQEIAVALEFPRKTPKGTILLRGGDRGG